MNRETLLPETSSFPHSLSMSHHLQPRLNPAAPPLIFVPAGSSFEQDTHGQDDHGGGPRLIPPGTMQTQSSSSPTPSPGQCSTPPEAPAASALGCQSAGARLQPPEAPAVSPSVHGIAAIPRTRPAPAGHSQFLQAVPEGSIFDLDGGQSPKQNPQPPEAPVALTSEPRRGPTTSQYLVASVWTPPEPDWSFPVAPAAAVATPMEAAQGKSPPVRRSLLQPQLLAKQFLPPSEYARLSEWGTNGCPVSCGPPWSRETIEAALEAGPHASATTPQAIDLIEADTDYQVNAGFCDIVLESDLLAALPENLKASKAATIHQQHRRDRIILNLSAPVRALTRRSKYDKQSAPILQPSVNETTTEADDQTAVKDLGNVFRAILFFMFVIPSAWSILFAKLDLSDGFWRMLVQLGQEFNFAWVMPSRNPQAPRRVVIPSALQMGWKNSPAYFCTVTVAICLLMRNLLSFTVLSWSSMLPVHPLECYFWADKLVPIIAPAISPLTELVATVFVDDFILAVAAPSMPMSLSAASWLARVALHAIHAVFPPPSVTGHQGGKDSISLKKLEQGDAIWSPIKELLGFVCDGSSRTVCLPEGKAAKYCAALDAALASFWISFSEFQQLHGRLQHVATILPVMKGFMTPLNATLKAAPIRVGLGKQSELREVLVAFRALIMDLQARPTHITELVPPSLPHVYGFCDASSYGAGGVWLPCTLYLPPIVWRLEWPDWVQAEVQNSHGSITNSDVEMAAVWLQWHVLRLCIPVEAVSAYIGSDNTPTVGWHTRMATRSGSPIPERFLRHLALTARADRSGVVDVSHIEGKTNLLGDIPSRSFDRFPDDHDFLKSFAHQFPLPPQLGSWQSVPIPSDMISVVISMLRRSSIPGPQTQHVPTGVGGQPLLPVPASPPFSSTCRPTTANWIGNNCSWPLLDPSGQVDFTLDSKLRARLSRKRFETAQRSWSPGAITIPGN